MVETSGQDAFLVKIDSALAVGLVVDDRAVVTVTAGENAGSNVMEWQQGVRSPRFENAISQTAEALKLDRGGGYLYFAESLNRACLRTFDLLCVLGADAMLESGNRPGATTYLQQKVVLCAYFASCPLLNVLLKLGGPVSG